MSDLLSVKEASLYARDTPVQPWQQAFVIMLAGEPSREQVMHRIRERVDYAPRFRRIVTGWPVPSWADDANFNLGGHVGEVTLGSGQRLEEWLAAQLVTPLDRQHPLWQATLVRGLAPGSTALVVRVHPVLVDGINHPHLLQELLDDVAAAIEPINDHWQPSSSEPLGVADLLRGFDNPLRVAQNLVDGLAGLVENTVRGVAATARSQHVAGVEVDLDALRSVRDAFGCTTHDVLLDLATAGLRGWLLGQGREPEDQVALVPLALAEPELESAIGCRVEPSWIVLPVSVANAAQRLADLAVLTRASLPVGAGVPARDLVELAGFAPPTMHAVAAGTVAAGRAHTVAITNVPGPQEQRFLGTTRVRRVYAVTGTTDEQQLSISITSYAGRVSFGAAAIAPLNRWARDIAAELAFLQAEAL